MLCSATTKRGKPCGNEALPGSDRCHVHRRVVVLDEAAVAQLIQMLRAGNYLEVAARAAGVPLTDLPDDLLEELEGARAEGEVRAIAQIARAAMDTWQAAAWLLERQYPERWSRPATRAEEKPVVPALGPDGVDELAGKRAARRAALR